MKQREVAEGGRGLPSPGRGGSFSLLTFRCRATAAPAQPPARGTISGEGWSRDRGRGRRGLWKLILAASTGSVRSVHWLWRQFRRISARSHREKRRRVRDCHVCGAHLQGGEEANVVRVRVVQLVHPAVQQPRVRRTVRGVEETYGSFRRRLFGGVLDASSMRTSKGRQKRAQRGRDGTLASPTTRRTRRRGRGSTTRRVRLRRPRRRQPGRRAAPTAERPVRTRRSAPARSKPRASTSHRPTQEDARATN